ncbi:unnamed protein product [Calicophoron daubneyi]|uniref:Uncharacterized protein n=1 Tax=Calicophoron daubneyi TaxID=300641 RepID=A0AAV2TBV7_CALDB
MDFSPPSSSLSKTTGSGDASTLGSAGLLGSGQHSRSKNRRKKKIHALTSTPLGNSRFAIKQENDYSPAVTNQSTSLYQPEERIISLLQQLTGLKKDWDSELSHSCRAFTQLATCILRCGQGRVSELFEPRDIPVEALNLLQACQTGQADKVCIAAALEKGFAEVRSHLSAMGQCKARLASWISRLMATVSLIKLENEPGSLAASIRHSSIGENPCSLILWPALLGEVNGLFAQIENDLSRRQSMLENAVDVCLIAADAYNFALMWRHLGSMVQWSKVLEMSEQAEAILR